MRIKCRVIKLILKIATSKKRTAQKKGCPTGQDFDHASGKCIPRGANRAKNSRSGSTKRKYNY